MSTTIEPEDYDLEKVCDAEIYPLMAKVVEICQRDKIPMIASFCYRKTGSKELDYCTTFLSRDKWSPPEFRHAINLIRNGFTSFAMTTTKGTE